MKRRIQTVIAWTLLLAVAGSLGGAVAYKIRQGRRKLDAPENNVLPSIPELPGRPAGEDEARRGAVGITEPFRTADLVARLVSAVMPHGMQVGRPVKAGEQLLQLDDSHPANLLQELELRLSMQQVELADARADLQRTERLHRDRKLSVVSDQQLRKDRLRVQRAELQLRLLQTQIARQKLTLRDYRIVAPFEGLVARLHVEVGESVMPGTPLVRVVQLDPLKVRVHLPAGERLGLQPGSAFTVRCAALPDYRGTARVHELAPEARSGSRRFQVVLRLPNPPGPRRLWPGMAVTLRPLQHEVSGAAGGGKPGD